jgi:hypothetical protein
MNDQEFFNFNTAGEQRSFDVIPANTICTLQTIIRPGGVGDGGWLKRSADGASEGLNCEFFVVGGQYANRRVWQLFTLRGTTRGHEQAGEISRNTLRAIVESARGIRSDDNSEVAQAKRKLFVTRQHLISAGFMFAPPERLSFSAVGGLFCGHGDGILVDGPQLPALRYPCLWEHKCLNAKGFRAIERDGLTGFNATYAAQVAIYQAYLDLTNAALFSVVNADTCDRLHFLVPFDAQLAQATSDRAVTVIEATRVGELLPRITEDPEDWRCKMCSHRGRCWQL